MARIRANLTTGGGGSTVKTGSFVITSTLQAVDIETGLSEIHRFVALQIATSYPNSTAGACWWTDNDPTQFAAKGCASYAGISANLNVNNGNAGLYVISVNANNDGVIKVKSTSGSYGTGVTNGTWYWYAE